MVTPRSETRVLSAALTVSTLLLVIKFLAYFITLSNTIFSDALESIINVVAGAFALWSMAVALRPRDRSHPYGHGKIEFISSGIEGALIIAAGVSILIKAYADFDTGKVLHKLDTGMILIIISGIANYFLGQGLKRYGKKFNSLILESNGKHLLTDAFSTLAITVGVLFIYFTGIYWLDDAFAAIAGVAIILTGLKIIRKSLAGIMDEMDRATVDELVKFLNEKRKPQWIDFHNLRTQKFGPTIHVDCHVTLPWYWTIQQGHEEIHQIEAQINDALPKSYEFFIHVDSCRTSMCRICSLQCDHRAAPLQEVEPLTADRIVQNKRMA